MSRITKLILLAAFAITFTGSYADPVEKPKRIVNIVNFIRLLEPRDSNVITKDVLYQTVVSQISLFSKYKLPASYLLQYDALIDPRYQQLLKSREAAGDEVGGWWEITQPHVEAAGLKWRGRYPWDWHANVGFSTGYTPDERKVLVDTYMEKFKSIFGKYPATIASWFIDEYSLNYMYTKYHIIASANCKDQVGTDGYTLWGGYWNQAYYPSKLNAYMPAQTTVGQIGVPVFRLLGSDPTYQYESGLGTGFQSVFTLEPVYPDAGGDAKWVRWLLQSLTEQPSLAFAYTQAGQENSFTWAAMQKGLELQAPLFDSLRKAGKITVETLGASGKWFTDNFKTTPATAVTALKDYKNEGKQSVWYNSKFYRANVLWSHDSMRIRDIHLFDEHLQSPYLDKPSTSTQCIYKTLPFVDGYMWGKPGQLAGLRLVKLTANGGQEEITCKNVAVTEAGKDELLVTSLLPSGEKFTLHFYEDRIEVEGQGKTANWALQLSTADSIALPFTNIINKTITAVEDGFTYTIQCKQGHVEKAPLSQPYVLRLRPENGKLVVTFPKKG